MRRKRHFIQYKWRLYADHNVEREVVATIRKGNVDVVYVNEHPQLKRQQDDRRFHAHRARRLGRYLLTRDEDFWSDRLLPLHESPGIILVRVQPPSEAGHAVLALRNLFRLFNRTYSAQHVLNGRKIRLGYDTITFKFVDGETSRKRTEQFSWGDLI